MDRRGILWICAALFIAGCSSSAPEPQSNSSMQVKSDSFAAGQAIPDKYTAYGSNVSPQLSWSGAPASTKTFVLLVEDPDAPRAQPFVHWLVFNIPATTTSVNEGQAISGGTPGNNDNGQAAYYGPKPPSGTHHYHFKVFAIDEALNLNGAPGKDEVMKAISGHTLAQGEVVGIYAH